jgi:beta-glucosidase
MQVKLKTILLAASGIAGVATAASAQTAANAPWMNRALSPDQRAAMVVQQMTRQEKLSLVFGYFATDRDGTKAPAESRPGSAGYVPGIPRLGIPAQWQTDAGVGVATQGDALKKRERTALPSGIATAATWNPEVAFAGGHMIGSEARNSGFNVQLAGGVNIMRDPRNGRNFEYGGEDPLLAGTIVGSEIAGIQSNHIISTTKHYAMNDLETGRNAHNAHIDHAAARMSDLLAFEFAIERGHPGSVMCSYNRVNGDFACENAWLLNDVLKHDFAFPGYVMSDWGAVHSTAKAANAGLDQESGWPFDKEPYFREPLAQAVAAGQVPEARLNDMATRIVGALFATGAVDDPVPAEATIDYAANAAVTRADAEQSMVLLKNDGNLLPVVATAKRIVIIGGHADKGVLAGSGSSLVYPRGGNAVPGIEPLHWPGPVMYYPSSPMRALQALVPGASVTFVDGSNPAAAAAAAKTADIAIVFVTQWAGESFDVPLQLQDNQDATVAAVAAANPRTAVVVESNGPVLMPWASQVPAIVEAWYPGTAGGEAIANVLTGRVNPSGRLPATFPMSDAQLPRPVRPGGNSQDDSFELPYTEGAAVGYKWFDKNNLQPLFPFGHGLSYTSFVFGIPATKNADGTLTADEASRSKVSRNPDGSLRVEVGVRNVGQRPGMDVVQVYVSPAAGGWEAPKRLGGFQKVALAPGASQTVSINVDPRLLATFDDAAHQWRIAPGQYKVMVGQSSRDISGTTTVTLPGMTLPGNWHPGAVAAQAPSAAPAPQGERG